MPGINKSENQISVRFRQLLNTALIQLTRLRSGLDGWSLVTILIAMITAAPLIAVAYLAFGSSGSMWSHLATTVLSDYTTATFSLMFGVGLGCFMVGTGTAWLTSTCDFPGRKIYEWALFLPMAVPAYIIAYIYTDLLEYAGPVQTALREMMGWRSARDYWFPEIRSLTGAMLMMSMVLYPYVYLLARTAFLRQAGAMLEAGRTLGRNPWQNFFTIALPMARPAIVVGVSLVMMEVLNDFGTVDFFALQTFTAGIYDVWLNMHNQTGAAQLAVVLMLFVLGLVFAERISRKDRRFAASSGNNTTPARTKLEGKIAWLASLICLGPIVLGFLVPAWVLLDYTISYYDPEVNTKIWQVTRNSLILSGMAAFWATFFGLILAYGVRLSKTKATQNAARIASIGYAVPGAVLAVGVMVPLAGLDNMIDGWSRDVFGYSTGLLFSGTLFAILMGYMARFMALSYGSCESGLAQITPNMEDAARTLGANRLDILKRIHMPLLKTSLATAVLLVFVDSMKELPMTMLLRPFNFETLATHVHQYASDELFEESAPAALMIVLAGILPVLVLSWTITQTKTGK